MSSKKQQSVGSEIYSGAAQLGRISSIIGLGAAVIIAGMLVIGGIRASQHRDSLSAMAVATIKRVVSLSCGAPVAGAGMIGPIGDGMCHYDIEYVTAAGVRVLAKLAARDRFMEHQQVPIHYDPQNVQSVEIATAYISPSQSEKIGMVMILFALLLVGAAAANYYLTRNYKFYAAAQGVAGGVRIISDF